MKNTDRYGRDLLWELIQFKELTYRTESCSILKKKSLMVFSFEIIIYV